MVLALGRIGDGTIIPVLMKILRSDISPEVRWRAAIALASLGDACLVTKLKETLPKEKDKRVRDQVEKAIGKLGRSKRKSDCPGSTRFTRAQPSNKLFS